LNGVAVEREKIAQGHQLDTYDDVRKNAVVRVGG
jgi:hypothetical protein